MSVWRIFFLTDRIFWVSFHKHSQNDENHFCTHLCSNLKHCAKRCLTETTHFNGTKCYRVCLLAAMSSWIHQFSYKSKCWMAFIFFSWKRTIFSFFEIFTVQWHCSVVAKYLISFFEIQKHFLHRLPKTLLLWTSKNTSSMDFRGSAKGCLTETTHFDGTKYLNLL